MNLVDILLMLQKEKNSLDWTQLKEEYTRQGKILDELTQAKSRLEEIKKEIQECQNKFTKDRALAILEQLRKINENDDPYSIVNIINEQYIQLEKCKKEMNDKITEMINKYKKIIETNNEKLKLYSRIYITILGKEEIPTHSFEISNDLTKLEEVAKESQDAVEMMYENIKNELKNVKLNEEELNLLIELLKTGNIIINRKNIEIVTELLRFLSQRGIVLTVKI
ncbi:hypothetical protein DFR86_02175 [Acidianus sulfidivorans JP7]|uniref:Uncharacterized protein n=1 Tax=Acidianus sulfidivorans JP7 TaxID=619593 RepID=A0A2U9IKD0_9CREN|nr:hypothetical protein [Acidianus sulfidivorans]AWR96473.1 hypothetical protein DFR86_02175 [Acidianus sulfidivorans JP7]